MPTIHYYGKKTNFVGKTLFEILANLKNFGVNRILIKNEDLLQNPGQKCYYIVKRVEPIMDDKLELGAIWAERVFKGAKVPELKFVEEQSWHTDWQLVPRHLENEYKAKPEELIEHGHPSTIKVLPRWMEVPPLMDIFLRRHYELRIGNIAPIKNLDTPSKRIKIMMAYDMQKLNQPHEQHRIAEEGEESSENFNQPLAKLLKDEYKYKPSERFKARPKS